MLSATFLISFGQGNRSLIHGKVW